MNQFLLTAATVLSGIGVLLHFAHMFKLDGVVASKVDQIADDAVAKAKATLDTKDDAIAQAEAAVLHSIAGMIRDGKVDQGVAALKALAEHKAAGNA